MTTLHPPVTSSVSEDEDDSQIESESTILSYLQRTARRQTEEDDELADRMQMTKNGRDLIKLLKSGKTPVFVTERALSQYCDGRVLKYIYGKYSLVTECLQIDLSSAIGPDSTEDELTSVFEAVQISDMSIPGIESGTLDFSFGLSSKSEIEFFVSNCDSDYKIDEITRLFADVWLLCPKE